MNLTRAASFMALLAGIPLTFGAVQPHSVLDHTAALSSTGTHSAFHGDPGPSGAVVHRRVGTAELRNHAGLAPVGMHVFAYTPAPADLILANGTHIRPTIIPDGTPVVPGLTQHVPSGCIGDGRSGKRVQLVYARPTDIPDRYSSIVAVLRDDAAGIDDAFSASARETGGDQRIRWSCDPRTGLPTIVRVSFPHSVFSGSNPYSLDAALEGRGLNSMNRKYLTFTEDTTWCGIADLEGDTQPGSRNSSNGGGQARVDNGCWEYPSVGAHELMHTLGAVQNNAPHTTHNGHCNDGMEIMCYADGGSAATQHNTCPDSHSQLYDCHHDDYYNTRPAAGSYLATHWNTARSAYLATVRRPVPPPVPYVVTVPAPPIGMTAGASFTLTATTNHATASYSWTSSCDPDNPSAQTVTFTCQNAGSQYVTVQATSTDGRAATARQDFTIDDAPPPLPIDPTPPINPTPPIDPNATQSFCGTDPGPSSTPSGGFYLAMASDYAPDLQGNVHASVTSPSDDPATQWCWTVPLAWNITSADRNTITGASPNRTGGQVYYTATDSRGLSNSVSTQIYNG